MLQKAHPRRMTPRRGLAERYMPGMGGRIAAEHGVRYQWALRFVAGKTVLDVASGEGSGAATLAQVAKHVIGVDLSEAAVDHAKTIYGASSNVEFRVGDILAIPVESRSIDVIVCFETIEHVEKPHPAIAELRRVLKPDGILLISTTNREIYRERHNYVDPFHFHEFSLDEFREALGAFDTVRIFWQASAVASVIGEAVGDARPLAHANPTLDLVDIAAMGRGATEPRPITPLYYIAVCSNGQLSHAMVQMGLIDLASDVLVEDEMILRSALDHPDINKSLLAAYLRLLDESRATIRSLEETSARLRRVRDSDLVHAVHEATVLRRTLEGLQREHRDLWAEIRHLKRLREELRSVYISTSWRALGGVRRFLSRCPWALRLVRGVLLLFSRDRKVV